MRPARDEQAPAVEDLETGRWASAGSLARLVVAHLQVTTMAAGAEHAVRAGYRDGELEPPGPRPAAGVRGTTVTVQDMFYNVAARRKALRPPAEEYARVLDVVQRSARGPPRPRPSRASRSSACLVPSPIPRTGHVDAVLSGPQCSGGESYAVFKEGGVRAGGRAGRQRRGGALEARRHPRHLRARRRRELRLGVREPMAAARRRGRGGMGTGRRASRRGATSRP